MDSAWGVGGRGGGGGAIETIAGLNLNFVHYVTFSHNHNCSNGLLRLQSLVLSRFPGRSRTTSLTEAEQRKSSVAAGFLRENRPADFSM